MKFDKSGVGCEMIVYNTEPLKDVFGRQIELLGIDVVHDMAESLLEDPAGIDDTIKKFKLIWLMRTIARCLCDTLF